MYVSPGGGRAGEAEGSQGESGGGACWPRPEGLSLARGAAGALLEGPAWLAWRRL